MDSRITKKRLSDYLSYQWIFLIVMCVVAIIVWELAYTIGAVRLTTGQHFKFYYDKTVWAGSTNEMFSLFKEENTFSYDVLSLDSEAILEENDILSTRLYVQEGDMLITSSKEVDDEAFEKGKRNIAKSRIDYMSIYSFEELSKDAKVYLYGFLKDSFKDDDISNLTGANKEETTNLQKNAKAEKTKLALATLVGENYSVSDILNNKAIEKNFRSRMKKDNRFRTDDEIAKGIKKEINRIEKLVKEVIDFDKLLALSATDSDLFYTYIKYEQAVREYQDEKSYYEDYLEAYQNETPKIYGLNVDALNKYQDTNDQKDNTTKYFQLSEFEEGESVSSKDVVLMAFNFRKYQADLQFECIAFINTMVKACSTILG